MGQHDPGHLVDPPSVISAPTVAGTPHRPSRVPLIALIVAVVALVLAVIPYACFAAGLPALVAIVLGFVGLMVASRRALAVTALAIGAVALATALAVSAIQITGPVSRFVAAGQAHGSTADPSASTSALPGLAAGPHTVVYESTGDGTAAISYSAVVEGSSGFDREAAATLPHRREQRITTERADAFDQFGMIVVAREATKAVGCRITIDGAVVAQRTSTSSSSTQFVTCTARTATP